MVSRSTDTVCCWSAVVQCVMLAHSSFVHTAPLSSSPPSIPSSPSSQSGAPAVAEGEPTVPEDGEGEECVCVHCNACVHTCIT